MSTQIKAVETADTARQRLIMEAAMGVFVRYGFRKTSMHQVAEAAQISRQGLYLHFPTKEALFRATLKFTIEGTREQTLVALAKATENTESRLLLGYNEMFGRYVGMFGVEAADLMEAAHTLTGDLLCSNEQVFREAVGDLLARSELAESIAARGFTPMEIASVLSATAIGLKHCVETRAEFVRSMQLAIRAICRP